MILESSNWTCIAQRRISRASFALQINKCNHIQLNIGSKRAKNRKRKTIYLHCGTSTTGFLLFVATSTSTARLSTSLGSWTIVFLPSIIVVIPKSWPVCIAQGVTTIPIIMSQENLRAVVWNVLSDSRKWQQQTTDKNSSPAQKAKAPRHFPLARVN